MFILKPFARSNEEITAIRAFCAAHPTLPRWPDALIARFLGELSSSPNNIIDIHKDGKRVAVGVLVDQISNLGNLACLEVVGLTRDLPVAGIYSVLLGTCALRAPANKDGFQISVHASLLLSPDFFSQYGMTEYYESYEMICENLASAEEAPTGSGTLEPLVDADLAELYRVARATALHSPDIAIPEFEKWKGSHTSTPSQDGFTWVLKITGNIVGYIRLADLRSTSGPEIRVVGVLPEYRRQGLGKRLLKQALAYAFQNGARTCRLSVAAQNETALGLYRDMGFEVRDRYCVYRSHPVPSGLAP